LAGDDDYTCAGAVERLITLLNEAERTEESGALIEVEEQREWSRQRSESSVFDNTQLGKTFPNPLGDIEGDVFSGEDDDLSDFSEPYIRPLPKIGRNEPCPYGSGKNTKSAAQRPSPSKEETSDVTGRKGVKKNGKTQ